MDRIERSELKRKEVPYFQVSNELFDKDNNLTIYQKIVYIYLCRCGNQGSDAFPSYNTIAFKCGISRRKAIETVSYLIECNLLQKQLRKKDSKHNYSNVYVINEPEDYILPSAQDAPPSAQCAPKKEHTYKEPIYEEQLIDLEEEKTSIDDVLDFYKKAKGKKLTNIEQSKLTTISYTYSLDIVLKAIDIMSEHTEKPSISYLKATLKDWKDKGLDTIEKITQSISEHENDNKKIRENKRKKINGNIEIKKDKNSNFNDYSNQRTYDGKDGGMSFRDIEKAFQGYDNSNI